MAGEKSSSVSEPKSNLVPSEEYMAGVVWYAQTRTRYGASEVFDLVLKSSECCFLDGLGGGCIS